MSHKIKKMDSQTEMGHLSSKRHRTSGPEYLLPEADEKGGKSTQSVEKNLQEK
jgi:hypothetical protein